MATALFRPGDRPLLHLALLLATLGTTFATFRFSFGGGSVDSLAFSLSVVTILGTHEMGHYVLARLHGVDTTLPYFIPLPLLGVGTLGAVIRVRSRIPDRRALVDIGAAGPLAGLIVALPLLVWGLAHSTVVDAPSMPDVFPGDTSLWTLGREGAEWLRGRFSPLPEQAVTDPSGTVQFIFGDNLLMRGVQRLVVGALPPGKDLLVHPVVVAAWFGMLITMLNLMPIGQLDGGHMSFAVFGRHARWVGRAAALAMLFLTVFVTAGWIVWLVVTTRFIGFGHPEVTAPEEPLPRSRKVICALCLLALIGCAMPVPLRQVFS